MPNKSLVTDEASLNGVSVFVGLGRCGTAADSISCTALTALYRYDKLIVIWPPVDAFSCRSTG